MAPSSAPLPSLATLATGLPPWLHQAASARQGRLDDTLRTLGEAFEEQGYIVTAYVSGPWFRGSHGWAQGMNRIRPLRGGGFAAGHLQSLGQPSDKPQMLWIHVPGPAPPNRRNVARADQRLGRMLDALRKSGVWEETLLVVTSPTGAEPGGDGDADGAAGLDRGLLEVPLVIKLPSLLEGGVPALAAPPRRRVALARVWSTLVAAVGGEVPPAAPPSLFAAAPDAGSLSAADGMDGGRELSLVEEDAAGGGAWQLLRRGRGGEPELSLLRWLPAGGVEAADDPARAAAMAERLRRRRLAFQECGRGPARREAAAGAADILLLPATGGGIPGP